MKRFLLIYTIVLAGCLLACQKENLTPSNASNPFAPIPGAKDETSVLRQEFYQATGCFLLFSDTLRHEYAGLDTYGKPYYETELLNLGWNMNESSSSPKRYIYEYIRALEQQREAIDFLQNYLVPYIKNIMPYSILVVNQLDYYVVKNAAYEYDSSPLMASDSRCIAINLNGLWDAADKTTYAREFCYETIFSSWSDPYSSQDDNAYTFYRKNSWDYEEDKSDYRIEYGLGDDKIERFYSYGFLVNTHETLMPTYKEDVISYIKACLTMTDEEFREKYGSYSKVITKYELVKPLVERSGIQF